ncbi:hypothetical protein BDZ91DRAFT_328309 [Kalaharituber pfeilii]|nr:hypothetical protein BDZ91DRAFT_328309 [Kalaharituber pfeilii]
MGDEHPSKKRKLKWNTAYSSMTVKDADERLGFRTGELKGIPVETMLGDARAVKGFRSDEIKESKGKVYERIVEFLRTAGYPIEGDGDFNEINIGYLVFSIVVPILNDFLRWTGRQGYKLKFEKEIVSIDSETGGMEELVLVDKISVTEDEFLLIIEAKRTSTGKAMRQCLLAMKDAWDSNSGGGNLYGFVTTGELWNMVEYDGTSFRKTEMMVALFDSMEENRCRWMKDHSAVVDCIFMALMNGGRVVRDV